MSVDLLFKHIMVCLACNFKVDVMKTPVPSDGFHGFCPWCSNKLYDEGDAIMRGLV